MTNSCLLTVVTLLITAQPQSHSIYLGDTARFNVEAEGLNRQYQWRFNGADMPGETNSTLTITNAGFSAIGEYSTVVSNPSLTLTSSVVKLIVKQIAIWGDESTIPLDLTNAVAIDAGSTHRLALRSDGTVAVWGQNTFGQTNTPPAATNVIAVSAGAYHSLALRQDGRVVAWGHNDAGQTNVPSDLGNVIGIAAGSFHSLALQADGTVVGWANYYGDAGVIDMPSGLTNVIAIAAGGYNSAALRANGQVVVWGVNHYGQTNVPPDLTNAVAISVGEGGNVNHILALRADGTAAVWGYGGNGQLGIPSGLSNVVAVSAGSQGMALKSDGEIVTWPTMNSLAGLHNVTAIANGDMALIGTGPPFVGPPLASQTSANGAITRIQVMATGGGPLTYQWSYNGTNLAGATNAALILTGNQSGQAGTYTVIVSNAFGTATNFCNLNVVPLLIRYQPQSQFVLMGTDVALSASVFGEEPISYQWKLNGQNLPGATNSTLVFSNIQPESVGIYSLAASNAATSILTESATLSVSEVLQWSRGNYNVENVPVGLTNVTQVASHNQHSLALIGDGTVRAWGFNNFGQSTVPAALSNVIAVAGGQVHSLALKSDGSVTAWGSQTTVAPGLSNVVAITAGFGHNMGLRADGTVAVWSAPSSLTNVPVQATNIVAIAAGDRHSLVLRNDGVVIGWGANDAGQSAVPAGLSNVISIAAGFVHSLALKNDGTVVVWGRGNYGAMVTNSGLSNVVSIAAGLYHNVALLNDGTVVAWGDTPGGLELDVPPTLPPVRGISGGWGYGLALLGDGPPLLGVALANATRHANQFSVTLPTESGRVYRLEYKNFLNDATWTALPLIAGDGKPKTLTDPTATSAQRFYRVRRW